MLDSLITSKTRLQLLLYFFLNPAQSSYLRRLAKELGESTNAIRVELNRLEEVQLLTSKINGREKWYTANQKHPLFPEINSIVKKMMGIDKLIEEVLANLGHLEIALVVGDYTRGIDSGIIDLVLVGTIDRSYLETLVSKAESLIKRRVRTLVLNKEEYENLSPRFKAEGSITIWE